MELILEKRKYIYRKSYHYYQTLSHILSINKVIFCASGLSAFIVTPLAALSLIAGVIEAVEKIFCLAERIMEYKMGFIFYNDLLTLLMANKMSEEEVRVKENTWIKNMKYFPLERYVKKMKLNGYDI